jgi:hypothetical protein
LKLGTVGKVITVGNNALDNVAGSCIILGSDYTAKIEFTYNI